MANNITKLREIGAFDISRKTKIPVEYVEYILDGNFNELSKLNAKAYLKIISREYDIDLSDFLAEYESFCNENISNENKKIQVNPRLTGYAAKDNHNYFIWIMLVLILLGLGVWGFKMIKDFDFSQLKPDFSKYESNLSSPTNKDDVKIEPVVEQNVTIIEQEISEENATAEQNIANPEDLNISENSSTLKNSQSLDSSNNLENSENSNALENSENKANNANVAKFTPIRNVWVGIKNLDDMSKRSFNAKEPFDVNLSGNRLVITGHGMLSVLAGDDNQSYNTKDALRFHAYDGKLQKLEYNEYVELNKGNKW